MLNVFLGRTRRAYCRIELTFSTVTSERSWAELSRDRRQLRACLATNRAAGERTGKKGVTQFAILKKSLFTFSPLTSFGENLIKFWGIKYIKYFNFPLHLICFCFGSQIVEIPDMKFKVNSDF